ncbi:hypothetical protein Y032_0159g3264 [Ancylostoma ceylanicum]|uniref:Uncharacterized protein n=1 Tax=Ancylostoma ceylanicum TaxID=53326 RepID=A0A016SXG8_9BILA|nr:hypothetical protein Y032_0159g3264 [Ancylostoma ceylanicum]
MSHFCSIPTYSTRCDDHFVACPLLALPLLPSIRSIDHSFPSMRGILDVLIIFGEGPCSEASISSFYSLLYGAPLKY